MEKISLYDFIKANIDDDYAMDVLFYGIGKTVADDDYSPKKCGFIILRKMFLPEDVFIRLGYNFSFPKEAIITLLTLRALRINKEWIKYCNYSHLLFEEYPSLPHGWIKYTSIIMDCMSDNLFNDLYCMLEDIITYGELSEEDKERLSDILIAPECRNLPNYYKDEAASKTGTTDEVICNNAFVCDDKLSEYDIPESVAYIGNTTFAYCSNLKEIRINNPQTLFGKFPIIECENLTKIIVPEGTEAFYKESLPHFCNIIFSEHSYEVYRDTKARILQSIKSDILPLDDAETSSTQPIGENPSDTKEDSSTQAMEIQSDIASIPPHASSDFATIVRQEIAIEPKSLKNVFDKEVTSYKYFWLMSIISLIKENQKLAISFDEIVIRMASLAWPLFFTDGLDFGSCDITQACLFDVKRESALRVGSTKSVVETYLKDNCDNGIVETCLAPLLKNVPYSFLSPWTGHVSNEHAIDLSNSSAYSGPYAIHNNNIIMDEDWFDYITENFEEIHNFVKDEFADFLKQHNSPLKLIRFIADKSF